MRWECTVERNGKIWTVALYIAQGEICSVVSIQKKGYTHKSKGQKTRSRKEDRNIIIFSGIEQPVSLIGKKWKTWALCISEKHHATHLRSPGSASSCNFQALLSKVLTWSAVTTVGTLASRGVPPQASAPVSSAIATSESETAVSSRG